MQIEEPTVSREPRRAPQPAGPSELEEHGDEVEKAIEDCKKVDAAYGIGNRILPNRHAAQHVGGEV